MKTLSTFIGKNLLTLSLALIIGQSAFAQKGSGEVIKESRKVGSFNAIKVGGAFDVYLRIGDKEDVTVVADDNLMDAISTTVSKGVLRIKTTQEIKNPTELKIYITASNINSIDISGACNLESKNTIVSSDLYLELSGASDAKITVKCDKLKVETSGASDLKISGSATETNIDCSGASSVKGEGLNSSIASVDSGGASSVKISVSEELIAKASGASSIHYKGNPKLEMNESGAADIKKL